MRLLLWALATLLLSFAVIAPAAGAESSSVLVLGRISDDPKAHYQQLKPLLDYVVPRLRDVGITEGKILMAPDAQHMSSYLRRGRVDWVTETTGTAMALQKRAGAKPLLLTERNGTRKYHSVFFVRRDSGVRNLADLKGRKVAMQSTHSTSAYVIPLLELLDAGLRPEILMTPGDVALSDSVGYVLARTELNISTYVHKGMMDAGVVSSVDWANASSMPLAFRRDFRILHETAPYPRAVEMVRESLSPVVRERLQQVLLEASRDPAAAPALQAFFGTSGFYRVDAASQERLEQIKDGLVRIRMDVE